MPRYFIYNSDFVSKHSHMLYFTRAIFLGMEVMYSLLKHGKPNRPLNMRRKLAQRARGRMVSVVTDPQENTALNTLKKHLGEKRGTQLHSLGLAAERVTQRNKSLTLEERIEELNRSDFVEIK